MKKPIFLLAFFFLSMFATDLPEYYKSSSADPLIEVFATRSDKKVAIKWLGDSKDNDGAILVVINGGNGKWMLKDSFINASRFGLALASIGNYRVFSLDMPSDEYLKGDAGGYGNEVYRLSRFQVDDIASVLAAVNKKNAPVYILTTSKSTISAANAAGSKLPNLRGVVLTAISADLSKMTRFFAVRSLWVHHKNDNCFNIGIVKAKAMAKEAKNSTFVSVENEAQVSGKECSLTNYHGFVERDLQIAKTIDEWIDEKSVPPVIK